MRKPYLLAPCGSYDAVLAAISAGADECYFGGSGLNARMNARGFTEEEFYNALRILKLHGVRSNITLNTLNFDRELPETLAFAKKAWESGADAFIVQDLGLARLLYESIPGVELHASTQCACHNLEGAIALSRLGFSRIVLARELPLEDIKEITEYGRSVGNFETEVFIHGALCVSHSGMCLMSSVIGGRSGNRGLCAQPCRMQGSLTNSKGEQRKNLYPLSLRDLTLSRHITELSELGIASLKIEGRMKSPDYVYKTVKILRGLIDKNENADEKRYGELSDIFSRGGFTDGYFTKKYFADNRKMYGFRSDDDKAKTYGTEVEIPPIPKVPVRLYAKIRSGERPYARLEAYGKIGEFTLEGIVGNAVNAPMTRESFLKNMSKLGSTEFVLSQSEIDLDDGLFLAASEINALRRGAVEALERAILSDKSGAVCRAREVSTDGFETEKRSCRRAKIRFITDNPNFTYSKKEYPEELESICLPLELFGKGTVENIKLPFGVRLPRVIFEEEKENIRIALENARDIGARYVYISNIGHIEYARDTSLPIYGGMGLNIANSQALLEYAAMGLSCVTLSTELKSAQMRDILRVKGVEAACVVRGRLPLMVLESCILRANGLCSNFGGESRICGEYTDRIGKKFPIYPERRFTDGKNPCRNIILNADILDLYSKKDEVSKCGTEILEIITE
ncbi:MAG: U32 family peptidase [Clostridia bacterium]|nr:U32 family peptidase [Clostridia bacterium]